MTPSWRSGSLTEIRYIPSTDTSWKLWNSNLGPAIMLKCKRNILQPNFLLILSKATVVPTVYWGSKFFLQTARGHNAQELPGHSKWPIFPLINDTCNDKLVLPTWLLPLFPTSSPLLTRCLFPKQTISIADTCVRNSRCSLTLLWTIKRTVVNVDRNYRIDLIPNIFSVLSNL